jgi:serine protease
VAYAQRTAGAGIGSGTGTTGSGGSGGGGGGGAVPLVGAALLLVAGMAGRRRRVMVR